MKNKRFNKIAKLLLSIMLIISLTGCGGKVFLTTGLDADQLLKVSGQVVPMSLARLILATEVLNYTEEFGEEIWNVQVEGDNLSEKLKSTVKQQLAELKTISMLANQKNIKLTNGEKEKLDKAAKEFFSQLSEEEIASLAITEQDVYTLYEYFLLSEKIYNLVTDAVDIEVSDEEARVIRVQYCFVRNYYLDESNNKVLLTGDGKIAAENRIAEAYQKMIQGNDFTVIAKQYSDDTVYEYEFGRGQMETTFEETAYSLENGETSEIIECENGYYIIKCIEDYVELKTEENKTALLQQYKTEEFLKLYEPFLKNQTYEYNDKEYEKINIADLKLEHNNLYKIYSQYVEE